MQLVEGNALLRGLVRVERGEDLVDALAALAQAAGWTDGYVTGTGRLAMVELRTAAAGPGVTLDGAELMSLTGRIVLRDGHAQAALFATVLVAGGLHSGQIVSALADRVLLVVDAVTARAPDRVRLPAAGEVLAPVTAMRAQQAAPSGSAPAPAPLVGSAIKPPSQNFTARPMPQRVASAALDATDENPIVEVGELLDHPQLGICEVVGEDDGGGTKIRVPSGRIRVLRLDAMQVRAGQTDAEGRMVYQVVGPRRRR